MANRIAIFASYSRDGAIADYVLYYLRGLKKVANCIVFVADCDLAAGEEEKLEGLVTYSKCERHGCYDFGSYRRGFEMAEQNGVLADADEVIFCNDSCYGPVTSFEKVFTEMDRKDCDFWGMAESHQMKIHLQSYFLVFKKKVFQSNCFKDYVHSFKKQDNFWDYVDKYEINFAGYLSEAGFAFASYLDISKYEKANNNSPINPTFYPIMNLTDGMPLLKRKVFGCQYCAVLRDKPIDIMNMIKAINKELYDIILHDVENGFSDLQRPCFDELRRLMEHAAKLEQKQGELYGQISYLEQLQRELREQNTNLEQIRDEQERRIHMKDRKITMLKRVLVLVFIASVLSAIYLFTYI